MKTHEANYRIRLLNHHTAEAFFKEEVFQTISEATFQSREGSVYIFVDWKKAFDDFMMYNSHFSVPCVVRSFTDHIGDNEYYVNYYLHQVFLALNLSSPGCCTFFGTIVHPNDSDLFSYSLELKGYAGKPYLLSSVDLWPVISSIPLRDTWQWVQLLSSSIHQIAQTRVERALYAMLYIAKENRPTANRLIWLSHALEALYDTPNLGISKALRDRIFLVLGEPISHKQAVKKAINSFYDLRSSFVHGDLAIAHPFSVPSLHAESTALENKIAEETDLPISIIWATVQLLIRNSWQGIEFSETFSGASF